MRFALERRDWHAAAALSAPAIGFPLERFPWAEAMISFARALGAAQTGDIPGAQAEIAKLQSLEDKLLEAKDTDRANQVEVQRLGAAGILAHVQGDDKKAVELVRAAADLDATMDKHPATPAAVLPARELLADLLLGLNQPGAALKEYEQVAAHRPQPLPQHPRQGPRRQAIGRHRGRARRLSKAGGAEQVGRVRAPRAVRGQSLPDELIPAGQQPISRPGDAVSRALCLLWSTSEMVCSTSDLGHSFPKPDVRVMSDLPLTPDIHLIARRGRKGQTAT